MICPLTRSSPSPTHSVMPGGAAPSDEGTETPGEGRGCEGLITTETVFRPCWGIGASSPLQWLMATSCSLLHNCRDPSEQGLLCNSAFQGAGAWCYRGDHSAQVHPIEFDNCPHLRCGEATSSRYTVLHDQAQEGALPARI